MGFLMDGLDAEAYDRKYTDGQLVRRILGYLRPQARRMLVVSGTIVLTALLDTGLPIFISRSLDQLQVSISTGRLLLIAAGLVVLTCSSWLFNAIRQTFSSRAV